MWSSAGWCVGLWGRLAPERCCDNCGMPFDWILLALIALLLLLTLWLVLRRADPGPLQRVRDELQTSLRSDVQSLERALRDEVARSATGTRTELTQTLASLQQTLLTQQGDVARTQNEQIDSFRTQLAATQANLADTLGRSGEQQRAAPGHRVPEPFRPRGPPLRRRGRRPDDQEGHA